MASEEEMMLGALLMLIGDLPRDWDVGSMAYRGGEEPLGRIGGMRPISVSPFLGLASIGAAIHRAMENGGGGPGIVEMVVGPGEGESVPREFFNSVVNRMKEDNVELMKECDGLRAACEELRDMVSKLRDRMVEQDGVIEKLAMGKSGVRSALS